MDQLCGTITYNASATVYTLECELTGNTFLLLAKARNLQFCEVTVEYKDDAAASGEEEEFAESNNGTVLLARRGNRPPPPPPKSVKDAEDAANEGGESEGSGGNDDEEESLETRRWRRHRHPKLIYPPVGYYVSSTSERKGWEAMRAIDGNPKSCFKTSPRKEEAEVIKISRTWSFVNDKILTNIRLIPDSNMLISQISPTGITGWCLGCPRL